ncbi:MAG: hypothetical protein KA761_11805, partial [Gemmatimonadaceae bacterium]|nr:hypothetical protein [Gemmatimonadaceae bacterium]
PPQLGMGTGPVTLKDLADYEGVVVPQQVREAWLQKVIDNGGQDLGGDVHLTPLALSIGRFAFTATSTLRTDGVLPPAMMSLLFFGNSGRTGQPEDFTLTDLSLDANATTTFAVAYGRRLPIVPIGDFAIGVTGKYVLGHAAASMLDNGSTITASPLALNINAPLVVTDTAEMVNGTGFGFDVGASWKVGNLRGSAVIHDLVSTFAWKTDNLYYLPIEATFQSGSNSEFTDSLVPLSSAAPALQESLKERIAAAQPTPTLALGVAWSGLRRLTLAADLRQRFGDGIDLGPSTQVGVGAELRLIPFVPLRAGVTSIGDGMRYSGGLGLEFGVVNFQVAGQLLQANGRNDTGLGLTLSFGGH